MLNLLINKIDLPSASINLCKEEIKEKIGLDGDNAVLVSAKTGLNVKEVLEMLEAQRKNKVIDLEEEESE